MKNTNKVFIATSIDGYIADRDGNIDWLHAVPNPEGNDMGYGVFMADIDAIVMGRNTFETVCGFDMDWPYQIPVYVLSNSLKKVPDAYFGKAELVHGDLTDVLSQIHKKGFHQLYIDGGKTIQSFLAKDLIDELTVTIIPVVLGGGTPLFSEIPKALHFECTNTKIYLNKVVQNTFKRTRL